MASPNGKTPHVTLYAAMIREIARKGNDARFVKTGRGNPYENRRPLETLKAVCHRFDKHSEDDTGETFIETLNIPFSRGMRKPLT